MSNRIQSLALVMLAAPVLADWDHEVKWDQLAPLHAYGGASFICYDNNCHALTADDFMCSGLPQDRFISDVEFYGWAHSAGKVEAFRITFWTDVPRTDQDESHPGDLLWECQVPYQYLGDNHFKINLPEECWFDQGVGEEVVYWISIQAKMETDGYPDYFYWYFLEAGYGWNDDAAFTATCWDYPPWYNWGFPTPDAPDLYEGPFPDGWYASADMSFRLTGTGGARISGYVRDADEAGVPDVLLEGDNDGGSASTNSEGYYGLRVPDGWSGTVTPSKPGWSFEPPSRTYEDVTEDQFDQDYTGEYHCVGDIDGDGDTDHADLGALLSAWDSQPGDPTWNPNADLDGDGHVYDTDLGIFLADWGCTE